MQSASVTQVALFPYRNLEEQIPAEHPLRELRLEVEGMLREETKINTIIYYMNIFVVK